MPADASHGGAGGDLVKMQILLIRVVVGPENLHFQPIPGEVHAAGRATTISAARGCNPFPNRDLLGLS